MRLHISTFLISAAALAFEILLLRVFAIEEFVHFAYMAISLGLLGFGASGTLLALLRERVAGREGRIFRFSTFGATLALLAAPWIADSIPFEPTQLVWEPRQWLALAALYVTLALPFLLAATAVAVAFLWRSDRLPGLYAANLLGSGAGAALALGAMTVLSPPRLPVAAAAAAGLASGVAWGTLRGGRARLVGRNAVVLIALAAVAVSAVRPPWKLEVTEYKSLPQALSYPDARQRAERSGPLGWLVAVEAPAYRYAPGLSLAFSGELPPQTGLFVDGVAAGAATHWGGQPEALEFSRWLPTALPYRVVRPGRVAVLGAGGGLEVLNALAHGASHVVAVELNPEIVELTEAQLDPLSSVYRRPGVRTEVVDARAFMERTAERFDIIQLATMQPFGAAAGGVYSLSEDYLHTVDALRSYMRRLAPGGVLAVTRWLRTPPRDHLKLLAMADEALRREGFDRRGDRVALFRSWSTGTLLIKPVGFTPGDLARMRTFAETRLLDPAWHPGIDSSSVNRFNRLTEPTYYRFARSLFGARAAAEEFVESYPFAIEAATDDRPYFGHFLKPSTIPRLLNRFGSGWLPFAEWGYLVLLATLVQAALVSALLILVPAALVGSRQGLTEGRWRWLLPYFGSIGLGYLFVEVATIQKLQLFLGHPVYAVLAALATFLGFSGLGSALLAPHLRRHPWSAALIVGVLAPLYVSFMPHLFAALAPAEVYVRGIVSALLLLPLAAAMGAPFPVALEMAAEDTSASIPWAWAVNGYASVLAVALAGILAVHQGFRWLMGVAGLLYLVAALVLFLAYTTRRAAATRTAL